MIPPFPREALPRSLPVVETFTANISDLYQMPGTFEPYDQRGTTLTTGGVAPMLEID